MRKYFTVFLLLGLVAASATPAHAGLLDDLIGGIITPKPPIVSPPGPKPPAVGAPGPIGGVFFGMPLFVAAGGIAYALLLRRRASQG